MGQGRNALPLARRGCQVTGIDTSQVAVDLVNRLAAEENLPLEAILQDFLTYEPTRSFDVVLCFGLMQMLDLAGLRLAGGAPAPLDPARRRAVPDGLAHGGSRLRSPVSRNGSGAARRSFRSPDGEAHRLFLEKGKSSSFFSGGRSSITGRDWASSTNTVPGKQERHGEVEAVLIRPRK